MDSHLSTKFFIPRTRPDLVARLRLTKQLDQGLYRKLTLISAPAGFGKTTLVTNWLANSGKPAAWLSLDEGDKDLTRILGYMIIALQPVIAGIGETSAGMLQSPQPPSTETILIALVNEISTAPEDFIFVLDDYHVLDSQPVDQALTFLLDHLPPQMHLVITTREDPHLPLAQLRARGQLAEVRAADLRFTPAETAEFLNTGMGFSLSKDNVEALEARTEGWIAGLQLAAISMRGHKDIPGFIRSFTGSHRFVLDYLVEEVLNQQPEKIQTFLLHTSVLDRLSGPLCDAVLPELNGSGQAMLESIERANLFLIPLDDQRNWFRYHQLFADLLRQRLQESAASSETKFADLHKRASSWYEENGLELDAFQHAVAADDIERAQRLMEGGGMPLQFRGALSPVLDWLMGLPPEVMNNRPALWVAYASVSTMAGKPIAGIEVILQAAENALEDAPMNSVNWDLLGQIAAIRAMLAIPQNQTAEIIMQSQRALEFLDPDNMSVRTSTAWALGLAHQLQGDRTAASQAFNQSLAISQKSGNTIFTIASATSLGQILESQNQLQRAIENFQLVLQSAGDPPMTTACEAHLGLARICYERNDLEAAGQHVQQSRQLSVQIENVDTPLFCDLLSARIKMVGGDLQGADEKIANAEQFMHQGNRLHRLPEITAAQSGLQLQLGNFEKALSLAAEHDLPISQAQALLAIGEVPKALEILRPYRQQSTAKEWGDELLKATLLEALACQALGEEEQALVLLKEVLTMAESGGFVRSFLDQGQPMAQLLVRAASQQIMPRYVDTLLQAFDLKRADQPLIEPLTDRELDVLRLVAEGLSNQQISERLFLALNTVKSYNRKIFQKLQVQRRTEAVARAQELGLL